MTPDRAPLLRLYFQAPAQRLTMNQRLHWAVKARATREWRGAACASGHQLRYHADIDLHTLPACLVRVTFHVPDNRRRDPHNTAPTVKAIIDGLVDCGFWRDDTPDQVAVLDPVFIKDTNDPTGVQVECWEMT